MTAIGWYRIGVRTEGLNSPRGPVSFHLSGWPEDVYELGEPGLTMPKLISERKPVYTREAMAARIQGVVALSVVVGRKGTVRDVRVLKGLEPGLDAEAVKAVKEWRFEPGTKDGQPVSVRLQLELTFSVKG